MPKIQGYEDRVVAQGAIQSQASPEDFGAGIGRAVEKFGYAGASFADDMNKVYEAQDVTEQHVNMAKARAEWTQTLQERQNAAVPGDDTFAHSLMTDMEEWFAKGSEAAKTPRGRQVYQSLAANMTGEFGQRAVFIQSELAAKDAVNKYDSLADSLGRIAYADQSQVESAIAQGHAAIDDPNGLFSKIPEPARNTFKQKLEQDAKFAAANGFVQHSPDKLLASIAPEMLAQFKPWEHLLKANTAPGGHVKVSPETMAKAPEVIAAAAAKDVNPNVLLALQDGGDKKDLAVQAGDLAALLERYGGNYAKAVAAFSVGTEKFDAVLQQHGDMWAENLPAGAQARVNEVMVNAGMAPSEAPTEVVQPLTEGPVKSTLPFLNGLPWKQVDGLVKEAAQLQGARLSMAARARAEQEHELDVQRDTLMNEMLQKVVDPKQYGTLKQDDILSNKVLTYQQKEHVLALKSARVRELRAGSEGHPNPGAFRNLVMRIHADPADPQKIRSQEDLLSAYARGDISYPELNQLKTDLDRAKDGGTSTFGKRVQDMREAARVGFVNSIQGRVNPAEAITAYYAFTFDLENQIKAKLDKKEDPAVLLDPSSREFVLKPERLKGFTGSAPASMAATAGKVVQQAGAQMAEGTVSASGKYVWKGGKWVAK